MTSIKYEAKKFFDMEIDMEQGIGSPYRIYNFIPILFLKYIPYKLGMKGINLC